MMTAEAVPDKNKKRAVMAGFASAYKKKYGKGPKEPDVGTPHEPIPDSKRKPLPPMRKMK